MIWAGIAVIALAGVAILVARRPLARMQAILAGGTTPAGCVIAEGLLLLLLAALFAVLHARGFFE
ncbi:MAG TPA: hypothetical protein VF980_00190 [Thermoanaerobaculia bacterium]